MSAVAMTTTSASMKIHGSNRVRMLQPKNCLLITWISSRERQKPQAQQRGDEAVPHVVGARAGADVDCQALRAVVVPEASEEAPIHQDRSRIGAVVVEDAENGQPHRSARRLERDVIPLAHAVSIGEALG